MVTAVQLRQKLEARTGLAAAAANRWLLGQMLRVHTYVPTYSGRVKWVDMAYQLLTVRKTTNTAAKAKLLRN